MLDGGGDGEVTASRQQAGVPPDRSPGAPGPQRLVVPRRQAPAWEHGYTVAAERLMAR